MADRLARNLVDAALELRRRREELPGRAGYPFLPLAGVLLEPGELVLTRGENAFVALVDSIHGEDGRPATIS